MLWVKIERGIRCRWLSGHSIFGRQNKRRTWNTKDLRTTITSYYARGSGMPCRSRASHKSVTKRAPIWPACVHQTQTDPPRPRKSYANAFNTVSSLRLSQSVPLLLCVCSGSSSSSSSSRHGAVSDLNTNRTVFTDNCWRYPRGMPLNSDILEYLFCLIPISRIPVFLLLSQVLFLLLIAEGRYLGGWMTWRATHGAAGGQSGSDNRSDRQRRIKPHKWCHFCKASSQQLGILWYRSTLCYSSYIHKMNSSFQGSSGWPSISTGNDADCLLSLVFLTSAFLKTQRIFCIFSDVVHFFIISSGVLCEHLMINTLSSKNLLIVGVKTPLK